MFASPLPALYRPPETPTNPVDPEGPMKDVCNRGFMPPPDPCTEGAYKKNNSRAVLSFHFDLRRARLCHPPTFSPDLPFPLFSAQIQGVGLLAMKGKCCQSKTTFFWGGGGAVVCNNSHRLFPPFSISRH